MADRRMFSKMIIGSGRFLKMPISTQALYFHLGLNADDDGVVEAYNVISSINGCTEDDLRVLVSKGFVQVMNEDLVTYIIDWRENNKIRADRKIDSIYKDLLLSMNPDVKLLEKRQRADSKPKEIELDDQWTSNGQPMDGIGKDRIGKDRIGKDSIGQDIQVEVVTSSSAPKEGKHKFGEYKHVLLKDSELEKLQHELGDEMTQACITYLDEYIEMKGYKAKSHYLCIKKWVVNAVNEKRQQARPSNKVATQLDQAYDMMRQWAEEE